MSKFKLKGEPHTTVKIGPKAVLVKRDDTIKIPDTRDEQFTSPTWEKIINKKPPIKNKSKKKKGDE